MTTDPEMDTDTTEMEMDTEPEMASEPEMATDTITEMEMATDMATKMEMATDTTDNGYKDGNGYRGRNGKNSSKQKRVVCHPTYPKRTVAFGYKNNFLIGLGYN